MEGRVRGGFREWLCQLGACGLKDFPGPSVPALFGGVPIRDALANQCLEILVCLS